MRPGTVEYECREHWYGPSLRKPRSNASSRRRWSYDYPAMAKLRRAFTRQM